MNATDATTPVTDAANAGDVTAIFFLVPGVRPGHRHVSDRDGAVPGDDPGRVRPVEPVEHQAGA